jgi:hypothetical protein
MEFERASANPGRLRSLAADKSGSVGNQERGNPPISDMAATRN